MADLNVVASTDVAKIDLTTAEFRVSGCAWCHPGGSVLEYDREGFRFDGAQGGLQSAAANPAPKDGDYKMFGALAGADASAWAGAGFFEVTGTTGVYSQEQLINQGTVKAALDPATSTWKTVGKKYATLQAGGVAEADCLMCHFSGQYANLERNYAFPGATAPKLAASLGLVGAGTGSGVQGLLRIGTKGSPGTNPNPAATAWAWNEKLGDPGTTGNPVMLRSQDFVKTPRNGNCALCHFPDKDAGVFSAGCADPTKCGPASKPLGFTAFQKYMPAGSTRDGDEVPNVAGRDGNNDTAWAIAKGRVEGGKRGESMNDDTNPDAHMKWPAYSGTGPRMSCTECHYNLEGNFAQLTDAAGTMIQAAVTGLTRRDHQFAKGDNAPDGKNMDQLDDTATCESCHLTRTHPRAGAAKDPAVAHIGFPEVHFQKISCKVCHVPWLNGPVDQDLADFTVGPYQTFERTQAHEGTVSPPGGLRQRRPLYMWRMTEHGHGEWEIQPFNIMGVAVVASATAAAGGEATAVVPTFQRLGKKAAEALRQQYGDADGNGLYDWTLNAPQGGDKALVVNKASEITDFVTQVVAAGGPANPVLHFYFNQFAVSHIVRPRSAVGNNILGSPSGGGCVMCHSSSAAGDPNRRAESVGFFDKQYQLFAQPQDGGAGLVQTSLPAAAPLTGSLERVSIRFPYWNPFAADPTVQSAVNLSNAPGETVGNSVDQGTLLGYATTKLATLKDPATGSFTILADATNGGNITPRGLTTVPGMSDTPVTYEITPDPGYKIRYVLVNGKSKGAITSYAFTRLKTNQRIIAYFMPL